MLFRFVIVASFVSLLSPIIHTNAQPAVQKSKQTKINHELYYNQLADSVYMITHYFPYYGGNSLVVLLDNHMAEIIDTPYDGIATNALLAWMNEKFGILEIEAIVTGFHQDNQGWK